MLSNVLHIVLFDDVYLLLCEVLYDDVDLLLCERASLRQFCGHSGFKTHVTYCVKALHTQNPSPSLYTFVHQEGF